MESSTKVIPGHPNFVAEILNQPLKPKTMTKTTRILSIVLMVIPSLMLIMSAIMKLSHAPAFVEGFSKSGLGNYLTLIGSIELIAVALFLYPKTSKIGFLLLCSYLGGAIATELASGQAPMAAVFLTLFWVAVYLRNKWMFLGQSKEDIETIKS